jgi:hypothetical protein
MWSLSAGIAGAERQSGSYVDKVQAKWIRATAARPPTAPHAKVDSATPVIGEIAAPVSPSAATT